MYAIRAWMSDLLSVFPQAGISADFCRAGPPLVMMAIKSASLNFFQRISFGERMRFHFEVVVIGDALGGGFGVMAAIAVLVIETTSECLLISESDLLQF